MIVSVAMMSPLLGMLASAEMSKTPPPIYNARPVAEAVEEIFKDQAFSFCHDENFPLSDREIRWCAEAKSALTHCPALAKACEKGARATERDRPRPLPALELPELPDVARLSLWAAFGFAIGLVLWLIARNVMRFKALPAAKAPAPAPSSPAALAPIPVVETDVQRLLARAQEAARLGALAPAIAFAQAALLRRLEGEGLVKVHASRTTSDYLRDLGRAAPHHKAAVAEILHAVDRAQYAAGRPTRELVDALIARVLQANSLIRPATVLLLALWSAINLSACSLERREDWEHSPSGVQAVIRLLHATGLDARERLTSIEKINEETGQLILLPNATLSREDWEGLRQWVLKGGRLVLAPGPADLPHWLPIRFASASPINLRSLLRPTVHAEAALLTWGADWQETYGGMRVAVPVEATVQPRDETPEAVRKPRPPTSNLQGGATGEAGAPSNLSVVLEHEGHVYAAEVELEEGSVAAFADRNLFTNAALLVADNARFVRTFLDGYEGRVEVAGDLAGLVSPNPIASVGRGRMAPFMAQVALFVAALFFARGTLFGRPRVVVHSRRRRFVEHVTAVGMQLRRAHAARHALSLLGAHIVERLRRRARLTGQSGVGALAETLARQQGRAVGEMARLVLLARDDGPLSTRSRKEAREELQEQAQAVATLSQLLAAQDQAQATTGRPSATAATTTNASPPSTSVVRITTSRSVT